MSNPESISCVVPCLNEHANLGVLIPGLITVLKKLTPRYEIIVVDDGSTDATPELVNRLAEAHPEIVYLQLSRNFGKENALSAELEAAQGQVVVSMDADLQHPPALIPEMLARWQAGADMVYGVRASRHDESAFKRIGTKLFYQLMRTPGGVRVPENAGDFRLMDRSVVDALLMLPERNRFMKGLFAWVGFKAEPFYYHPPERLHGTSTFKPFKLFGFAIDGLTAFTTWPLRVLSVAGILISCWPLHLARLRSSSTCCLATRCKGLPRWPRLFCSLRVSTWCRWGFWANTSGVFLARLKTALCTSYVSATGRGLQRREIAPTVRFKGR